MALLHNADPIGPFPGISESREKVSDKTALYLVRFGSWDSF